MKLTILGGGGFRVPLIHEAIVSDALAATGLPAIAITELALHDSDPRRLEQTKAIIDERSGQPHPGEAPRLVVTSDLREALRGADFVFSAVRVGGAIGRVRDERVALDLGLLGQETIGPGGLAYALRTVPVMMEIAHVIDDVAPGAWVINFTNPAGIVTQAMQRVLGDRVVGICDTPIGLVRRVSRLLGVDLQDHERVHYDYVGLNHMGWLRSVHVDGVDRLPSILSDDTALDEIEEARVVGKEWLRTLGVLPNEYLYYYWRTDEAVRRIMAAEQTRGEFLLEQQKGFQERLASSSSPLEVWREALRTRESTYMAEARDESRRESDIAGGGYQEVALRLMNALATGATERMILNVANGLGGDKVVPQLPDDVVVETGCEVSGRRIHPLPAAPVTLGQLGMMSTLRASESAIAEAAITRSADRAWEGFSMHPLVSSPELGARLLDGYRRAHPGIDALFATA